MSQAVEGTHTTAVGKARRHRRHRTPVRAMGGRNRRNLAVALLLMAVALIMIAAAIYTFLGEKVAVSPSLWKAAAVLCRVTAGLFGLLAIVSTVTGRRTESGRDGFFGSIVTGVVLIAAAVAGLGLVTVMTGIGGLVLLYAGGAVAVDAFRRDQRSLDAPAR